MDYPIHELSLMIAFILANRAEPDEMLPYGSSLFAKVHVYSYQEWKGLTLWKKANKYMYSSSSSLICVVCTYSKFKPFILCPLFMVIAVPSNQCVYSFLASGDFCRLLITFAISLDPDQDQQNVAPDLHPNCLKL